MASLTWQRDEFRLAKLIELKVAELTSAFRQQDKQYSNSITVPMRRPTSDTALLTASAVRGLQTIYRTGYNFAKAGVMLLDIQDGEVEQQELDLEVEGRERSGLLVAMDKLNDRFGRGAVVIGSARLAGEERKWVMTQEFKTPSYTTHWKDMPVARAC